VYGGAGDDDLFGELGDDLVYGGLGEDAMIGDRWIKGKSRHDPALVLTERGWVEA